MNIDPDNDDGDSHRGSFRHGVGRKRKTLSSSIQMMANERRERAALGQEISRYRAKLAQWTNDMKWSHQGVQSTYRDNAIALLVMLNLMLEDINLTQTEAVTKAVLYIVNQLSPI